MPIWQTTATGPTAACRMPKEAIAVETRSTVLNYLIQERMKDGEVRSTEFGEIFRNIFGWHVMRPSAMDKELFNDLYRMYIKDENKLAFTSTSSASIPPHSRL